MDFALGSYVTFGGDFTTTQEPDPKRRFNVGVAFREWRNSRKYSLRKVRERCYTMPCVLDLHKQPPEMRLVRIGVNAPFDCAPLNCIPGRSMAGVAFSRA